MATRGLFFASQFGAGSSALRINANRIVPESASSAWRKSDLSFTSSFKNMPDARTPYVVFQRPLHIHIRISARTLPGFRARSPVGRANQRDGAYKASCPLFFGHVFHLFEQ